MSNSPALDLPIYNATGPTGGGNETLAALTAENPLNGSSLDPINYPTDGADTYGVPLATGTQKLTEAADHSTNVLRPEDSSNGDTYEGDPYDKGGFLDRPQGWQR